MVDAYIVLLFHICPIPCIHTINHLDLNRSQPPLFIWVRSSCDQHAGLRFFLLMGNQMLSTYVSASNDTSILDRALPLAEACSHSSALSCLTNIYL